MKLLGNIAAVLCTLSALAAVGFSRPAPQPIRGGITSEEFMKKKTITVRSDGTPFNGTLHEDLACSSPCISTYTYTLDAQGGNPHQNYIITQKGGTLQSCSGSGDSTISGVSHSTGWSLSLGVNSEFSSLGFSVSSFQTISATQSYACDGVAQEGGDVCVLFYQAVTAFGVDMTETTSCPCGGSASIPRGHAVVYAPNSNGLGSIPARGINVRKHGVMQCLGNVDRTIYYYCGPPGLSDYYNTHMPGPWYPNYVNNREPAGCAIPIEAMQFDD